MGILIDNRQRQHPISTRQVRRAAQALLDALDSPDAELSVLILDDRQIELLNRKYLNRSGPTNVLAFPMQEGDFTQITPGLLGDVVISVETAAREAGQMQIETEERIKQLLIHGVLHLFGYDHETGPDAVRKMDRKSEDLLSIIANISLKE